MCLCYNSKLPLGKSFSGLCFASHSPRCFAPNDRVTPPWFRFDYFKRTEGQGPYVTTWKACQELVEYIVSKDVILVVNVVVEFLLFPYGGGLDPSGRVSSPHCGRMRSIWSQAQGAS